MVNYRSEGGGLRVTTRVGDVYLASYLSVVEHELRHACCRHVRYRERRFHKFGTNKRGRRQLTEHCLPIWDAESRVVKALATKGADRAGYILRDLIWISRAGDVACGIEAQVPSREV